MANMNQERYSALVDAKLRYTLVKKNGVIFNNRYEGDPKAGAVRIPVRDTEVAVDAYDRMDGAAMTHGDAAYQTVTIDKDYAVNELIDGFDVAAVPDNLVADRLDSAGYSLALKLDHDATACLEGAATPFGNTTALTATTAYDTLVDARKQLTKANVPGMGRFLLASPDFYAVLLKDKDHFIHATQMGDEIIATGAVGQIAGFTVFEDSTLSATTEFIAGHPDWCCRVEEWQVPVSLVDLTGSGKWIGASAVQGRKIYAHKVTKPATLLIKKIAG